MPENYDIEKVDILRKAFITNAVEIYSYTPGMAIYQAVGKATQSGKSAANSSYLGYQVPEVPEKGRLFNAADRLSALGTPVIGDLDFADRVSYTKYVNGKAQEVTLANFLPIDTVLFQVEQSKNIVKTDVQGLEGGGSVIEYLNDGDYSIRIRGGIYGKNGVYPKEEVQNLLEYLRAPVPLTIYSEFLQLFEIFEVVVERYRFPTNAGRQSEQLFDITCRSVSPAQLIL